MRTLVEAFNPAAVEGIMCRSYISVGYDGNLHDCDFNQQLRIGMVILDFDLCSLKLGLTFLFPIV